MYEMAKKEVDKKKQEYHDKELEKGVEDEPVVQLTTKKKQNKKKKLTKKQLKELKSKNQES